MKKLSVLLFALFAVAMFAKADKVDVVASDIKVATNAAQAAFTVKYPEGFDVEKFSAFQMDITFPAGIKVDDPTPSMIKILPSEVVTYYDEEEDEEVTETVYKHTVALAWQSENVLRIVCYSNSNEPFKPVNSRNVISIPKGNIKVNSAADGTYQVTVSNVVFSEGQTRITFDMTEAGWGTLILPFEAKEIPEKLTAYTCAEVDGKTLNLVKVEEKLEANTPYILEGEAGSYEFVGMPANEETEYTVGALTGVLEAGTAPEGSYVLQNQEESGVGFYRVATTAGKAIKANRCYLNVPAGALMYRLGGTTNIEEVIVVENDDVYDLLGRKVVGPLQKGVYIKGGRKIYVK